MAAIEPGTVDLPDPRAVELGREHLAPSRPGWVLAERVAELGHLERRREVGTQSRSGCCSGASRQSKEPEHESRCASHPSLSPLTHAGSPQRARERSPEKFE